MARWSNAMKLTQFDAFMLELKGISGVYELGYVRKGEFFPKYIGKATCLYRRVSSYMDHSRCHNENLRQRIDAMRHDVWFHVFKTRTFAIVEARMLVRHGIGRDAGLYEWNKRYELSPLLIDDDISL